MNKETIYSLAHTSWNYKYHILFAPKNINGNKFEKIVKMIKIVDGITFVAYKIYYLTIQP